MTSPGRSGARFWSVAEATAAATHDVKNMRLSPLPAGRAPPGANHPIRIAFMFPAITCGAMPAMSPTQPDSRCGTRRVMPGPPATGHRFSPITCGFRDTIADTGVAISISRGTGDWLLRARRPYAPVYVNPLLLHPWLRLHARCRDSWSFVVDVFLQFVPYTAITTSEITTESGTWDLASTAGVVYNRRFYYDPIFSYAVYEHRYEPGWGQARFDIYVNRGRGIGLPPRTDLWPMRAGGWRGPGLGLGSSDFRDLGCQDRACWPCGRIEAQHHAQAAARQVAVARARAKKWYAGPG